MIISIKHKAIRGLTALACMIASVSINANSLAEEAGGYIYAPSILVPVPHEAVAFAKDVNGILWFTTGSSLFAYDGSHTMNATEAFFGNTSIALNHFSFQYSKETHSLISTSIDEPGIVIIDLESREVAKLYDDRFGSPYGVTAIPNSDSYVAFTSEELLLVNGEKNISLLHALDEFDYFINEIIVTDNYIVLWTAKETHLFKFDINTKSLEMLQQDTVGKFRSVVPGDNDSLSYYQNCEMVTLDLRTDKASRRKIKGIGDCDNSRFATHERGAVIHDVSNNAIVLFNENENTLTPITFNADGQLALTGISAEEVTKFRALDESFVLGVNGVGLYLAPHIESELKLITQLDDGTDIHHPSVRSEPSNEFVSLVLKDSVHSLEDANTPILSLTYDDVPELQRTYVYSMHPGGDDSFIINGYESYIVDVETKEYRQIDIDSNYVLKPYGNGYMAAPIIYDIPYYTFDVSLKEKRELTYPTTQRPEKVLTLDDRHELWLMPESAAIAKEGVVISSFDHERIEALYDVVKLSDLRFAVFIEDYKALILNITTDMKVTNYEPLNPVLPNGETLSVLIAEPSGSDDLIWLMTNYGPLQYNILTKEIFPYSKIIKDRSLYYASMARLKDTLLFADRFSLRALPSEGFSYRFDNPVGQIFQYDVAVKNTVERRLRLDTSQPISLSEDEELVRLFVSDGEIFAEGHQQAEIMYSSNKEYIPLNDELVYNVTETPAGRSEFRIRSYSFVGNPIYTTLIIDKAVPFYQRPMVTYSTIALVFISLVALTFSLVRKYIQTFRLTQKLSTISECFDSASEALVGVDSNGTIIAHNQRAHLFLEQNMVPTFNFIGDKEGETVLSDAINNTFASGEWEGAFVDQKSGAIVRCHMQKTSGEIAVLNLKETSVTDKEGEIKARGELESFMVSKAQIGNYCILCLIPTKNQLLSSVLTTIESSLIETGYKKYSDFQCSRLRYNDVAICIANKDLERVFAMLADVIEFVNKDDMPFHEHIGAFAFDRGYLVEYSCTDVLKAANHALSDSKRNDKSLTLEPQETHFFHQSYKRKIASLEHQFNELKVKPIIQVDVGKPLGYQVDIGNFMPMSTPFSFHYSVMDKINKLKIPTCSAIENATYYVNWPLTLPLTMPEDYFVALAKVFNNWLPLHSVIVALPIDNVTESVFKALDQVSKLDSKIQFAFKPIKDIVGVMNKMPSNLVSTFVLDSAYWVDNEINNYWQTAQGVLHLAASKSVNVVLMNINDRELSKATVYGFGLLSSDYLEKAMSIDEFKTYNPKLYLSKINDIEFYFSKNV